MLSSLRQLSRPVRSVRNTVRSSFAYGQYLRDFGRYRRLARGDRDGLPTRWSDRYPCVGDRTATTRFDRHYVYHTAWAARILAQLAPQRHVDIASSLYFAGIASAFVDVDFYDYRPAELDLSGLVSRRVDVTNLTWADASVPSLSCMHVVEHIGLGRYGDPLDPSGDRRAMNHLQRVVAPGGSLLFVVPVGEPRVCYNAHRIYSYEQIVAQFAELTVRQFALVPDRGEDGGLILEADPRLVARQRYGCGCFWFTRPDSAQFA